MKNSRYFGETERKRENTSEILQTLVVTQKKSPRFLLKKSRKNENKKKKVNKRDF